MAHLLRNWVNDQNDMNQIHEIMSLLSMDDSAGNNDEICGMED
jgi:hypothetical protein